MKENSFLSLRTATTKEERSHGRTKEGAFLLEWQSQHHKFCLRYQQAIRQRYTYSTLLHLTLINLIQSLPLSLAIKMTGQVLHNEFPAPGSAVFH
jgi:hypothetical protein